MKASWLQGLEPDVAKEIRGDFKSSLLLRRRMKVLLDKKVDANRTSTLSKDNYEISNWAFKQADAIGYERALKEVIELILDDEK